MEYILAVTKEGVTIYSSCFGTFCTNLAYDETLMGGFISALSTMPDVLGHDDSLQTVEMGYTKLLFNHTHPSGHIICLGVIKDTMEEKSMVIANELFEKTSELLENSYKDQEWAMISNEEYRKLEETMVHRIIEPTLSVFEDNDICDHNECPFDHEPQSQLYQDHAHVPAWEFIPKKFEEAGKKLPWYVKLLLPIVTRIERFFDMRLYKRETKKVKKMQEGKIPATSMS